MKRFNALVKHATRTRREQLANLISKAPKAIRPARK